MIQAAAIALIALILTPGLLILLRRYTETGGAAARRRRGAGARCGAPNSCALVLLTLGSLAALHRAQPEPGRSRSSAPTGGSTARWPRPPSLIFAWALSAQAHRIGADSARRQRRRRTHRALRHRAVFRLGPDPARRGLSHRRRHLDHRAPAFDARLCELLRHLAALRRLPEPGPARPARPEPAPRWR